MKARLLKLLNGRLLSCEPSEATHLELHFPLDFEPLKVRIIPIQTTGKREGTSNWTWNGDLNAPTLRPSILTTWEGGDPFQKVVCHSYVENGVVSFLYDSSHDLSGKSRPLLDFDLDDTFDLGILT